MSFPRFPADQGYSIGQGADLTAGIVGSVLMADTTAGRVIVTTANTDRPYCVLAAEAESAILGASVRVVPLVPGYIYDLVADEAITLGARVTPITGGRVTDALIGAGDFIVGIALTAAAAQFDHVSVVAMLYEAQA